MRLPTYRVVKLFDKNGDYHYQGQVKYPFFAGVGRGFGWKPIDEDGWTFVQLKHPTHLNTCTQDEACRRIKTHMDNYIYEFMTLGFAVGRIKQPNQTRNKLEGRNRWADFRRAIKA